MDAGKCQGTGINPERIAVAGGSAGGYLALMVGLTDEKPELGGNPQATVSSRVSAVINMYGVTSCDKHGKETLINAVPDAAKLFSPINYVSSSSVPVLILHGSADKTVDIKESKNLEDALIKNKSNYYFVTVDEAEHTFDLHPKGKGWKLDGIFNGKTVSRNSDSPDVRDITLEFLELASGK
jgi:dipeptidyl aminopeptidase/acylaminoacyl peptidase